MNRTLLSKSKCKNILAFFQFHLVRKTYIHVERNLPCPSFRNHPKNRKKTLKADRQLKTIADQLVRELEHNLGGREGYEKMFELYYSVLLCLIKKSA